MNSADVIWKLVELLLNEKEQKEKATNDLNKQDEKKIRVHN